VVMIGRTQYAYITGPLLSAFTRYGRNISPHDCQFYQSRVYL